MQSIHVGNQATVSKATARSRASCMFDGFGTGILRLALVLSFSTATNLWTAQATPNFPIATNSAIESGFAAEFDGSNYLVAVLGGPLATGDVTAKLVSETGAVVCTINVPGESGGLPELAFDGTNYLMVWSGPGSAPAFNGQFVTKTCGLQGSVLRIGATSSMSPRAVSVAFGADRYLACWSDQTHIYGRLITPDGQIQGVSDIISRTVDRPRENGIAFDGSNFFVVFNGGGGLKTNIYGQFVSTGGQLIGDTVLINNSTDPCDNPLGVAFDGTNYLVTFNEQVGGEGAGSFHVFGRLVSTTGAVLTAKIPIADGPGIQLFPFSAFDGSNYLVSWAQLMDPTDFALTLRFFDRAIQPVGPEFSPFLAQGMNRPVFGAPLFDGERFLVTAVLANFTNGLSAASADVYGAFLPSSTAQARLAVASAPVAGECPLLVTGTPGINYAVQMATNPALPDWTALVTNSPTNGIFTFTDTSATNAARFYRARLLQ